MHGIAFEILTEFWLSRNGLLASKLRKKASTILAAIHGFEGLAAGARRGQITGKVTTKFFLFGRNFSSIFCFLRILFFDFLEGQQFRADRNSNRYHPRVLQITYQTSAFLTAAVGKIMGGRDLQRRFGQKARLYRQQKTDFNGSSGWNFTIKFHLSKTTDKGVAPLETMLLNVGNDCLNVGFSFSGQLSDWQFSHNFGRCFGCPVPIKSNGAIYPNRFTKISMQESKSIQDSNPKILNGQL